MRNQQQYTYQQCNNEKRQCTTVMVYFVYLPIFWFVCLFFSFFFFFILDDIMTEIKALEDLIVAQSKLLFFFTFIHLTCTFPDPLKRVRGV